MSASLPAKGRAMRSANERSERSPIRPFRSKARAPLSVARSKIRRRGGGGSVAAGARALERRHCQNPPRGERGFGCRQRAHLLEQVQFDGLAPPLIHRRQTVGAKAKVNSGFGQPPPPKRSR